MGEITILWTQVILWSKHLNTSCGILIDQAHGKITQNACPLPKNLTQFSGYNDYKKCHHKTPVITSEKLNDFLLDLTKALSFPSMLLSRHKELSAD